MMAVSLITEIWVWQGLFQVRKLNFRYCLFPRASQNVFLLSPKTISLIHKCFGPSPYAQTWVPMTLTHWPLMIPFSPTPNPETSSVVKGVNKHHPSCLHWRPCKRIHLLMVKRRRVTQRLITKKLSFSWSKLKWMVKWMLLSKRCLYCSWGILKPSTAKSESRETSGPLDKWMKTKQGKKSRH